MSLSEDLNAAINDNEWFQRKNKGVSIGDVFSIPLASGGYGFARVLNTHGGAAIAEVFRFWSQDSAFSSEILGSGRLFAPMGFALLNVEFGNRKRPWKVIHKDPEFFPADLLDLRFSENPGGGARWTYYTLRDTRKEWGEITREDVMEMRVPSLLPQHPDWMANKIEAFLKAEGIMPE